MRNLLNISRDTTAFPWGRRTPFAGVPAVAGMGIALLLGWAAGHESAGAIAAGSAFTVGFAVFHETLASTLLSMGLVTLGISSATLIGSLGAHWTPVVLLLAIVAAVNYALLSEVSPAAGWIGQQCAIFYIVSSYFPLGVHYAVGRTEMVLAGGGLQMAVGAAAHALERRGKDDDRVANPIVQPPVAMRFTRRISQMWTQLTQMHLRGDTFAYALRLAATLLIATAVYRYFHVRNGYWSPMTALLVLKPQWSDTLSRGIARMTGTVGGAAIALLLARTIRVDTPAIFLLVVLCAFGCYALQAVNYALFSLFITLYIVFLFRFGGFSQTSAAHIRLYNTLLGGTIALLMDASWKLLGSRGSARSGEPAGR